MLNNYLRLFCLIYFTFFISTRMGLEVFRDCFHLEGEHILFLLNEKTPAKFSFKSMQCSSNH